MSAHSTHRGTRLTYVFTHHAVEINSMDEDGDTISLARVSMWPAIDYDNNKPKAYWVPPTLTIGEEAEDEYTRTLAKEALRIGKTVEAIWSPLTGKPFKWDALEKIRDHTLALTLPERFRRALACSGLKRKRTQQRTP